MIELTRDHIAILSVLSAAIWAQGKLKVKHLTSHVCRKQLGAMASGDTVVASKLVITVSGGGLAKQGVYASWTPNDVEMLNGKPFIALCERDHMLKVYLGIKSNTGYFKYMGKKRNDAVDEILLQQLREIDEFAMELPPSARKNFAADATLPKTIFIKFGEGSDGVEVLTDVSPNKKVRVSLTAPNLNALRLFADEYMEHIYTPQKRHRAHKVTNPYDFIMFNVPRRQVSADVRDHEGKEDRHRYVVKGEWTQPNVNDAVEAVVAYVRDNHHALKDGEYVLASEHGLEMFEPKEDDSDASDDE
jgi:hypothetical protein